MKSWKKHEENPLSEKQPNKRILRGIQPTDRFRIDVPFIEPTVPVNRSVALLYCPSFSTFSLFFSFLVPGKFKAL